jgi:hypothetical protein
LPDGLTGYTDEVEKGWIYTEHERPRERKIFEVAVPIIAGRNGVLADMHLGLNGGMMSIAFRSDVTDNPEVLRAVIPRLQQAVADFRKVVRHVEQSEREQVLTILDLSEE